jgi:hypothetical protein
MLLSKNGLFACVSHYTSLVRASTFTKEISHQYVQRREKRNGETDLACIFTPGLISPVSAYRVSALCKILPSIESPTSPDTSADGVRRWTSRVENHNSMRKPRSLALAPRGKKDTSHGLGIIEPACGDGGTVKVTEHRT